MRLYAQKVVWIDLEQEISECGEVASHVVVVDISGVRFPPFTELLFCFGRQGGSVVPWVFSEICHIVFYYTLKHFEISKCDTIGHFVTIKEQFYNSQSFFGTIYGW